MGNDKQIAVKPDGRTATCKCCGVEMVWGGDPTPECPRGCRDQHEGEWCPVCREAQEAEEAAEEFERSLETAGEDLASEVRVDKMGRGQW